VDALDPGGHIRVVADAHHANGGPPGLRLRITDDGKGIAPGDLEHIFQPFFTTKEIGRGTGLGLTITQDIARAHGGSVRVESSLGGGTTIDITIGGGARA
jgi:two-component system NtrC family sensor kinase